ncbi:hypothetical protein H4F73_15545 [Enterobacter hormaechei]|nr:DUF551 domain-containing protein [Enterobacter hormaechei]MBN4796472.1 hypothetical protein [Enterobacter hormaechei]MBN4820577.1 hypothetical protein [Enterobacter hormaechei]
MSTLTKEWLLKTIADLEEERDATPGAVNEDAANALAAMKLAQASLEAEPVAWRHFQKTPTYVGYWILNDYKPNCSGVEPLYTAPPAPESVPDGVLKSLLPDAEKSEFWFEHDGKILFEGVKFNNAVFDACRAAMLQGAEPVTTAYKLPANTPCKEAPEHIWLQTAGVWPEDGEFSELTWCSDNQHPDDTLYVRADIVAGNSPVIPDDVRRMDWLVSKTVDVREPMVYGSHSLFWSQTITDEEDDYHATKLREQIDAAMAAENAAAPQQEVK